MVSIRSLTAPILTHRRACRHPGAAPGRVVAAMHLRDVVPPRPPARRQPRPARGLRRRRRSCPLFVLDPALWGPAGPVAPAPTSPPRCAPSTPRSAAAGRLVGGPRRPGAPGGAGRARGRRRRGSTSPPTTAPTAARRDARGRARRWPTHGIELVRTGSPYAVAPGRVDQRRRRRRTRSSRRSPGPGPSTAGAARSTPPTGVALARRSTTPTDIPDADAARRPRAPRGRRGGGPAALAATFLDERLADYDDDRDRPGVDGTSRMSVHLKWGEIHPRTMLADLARLRSAGRGDLPQGARLARVLRRRAVPPAPTPRATTSARSSRGWSTTSPGERFEAWRRGPHRLPDRRRRDAPAARDRLDAQPGPDDRGELPGQGPARGVAARRPALHAAGWSTATWPPTSTAGSGWPAAAPTRRRTSGSSTRPPRAGSSTPTAPTSGAGCRSCADVRRPARPGSRRAADVGYPEPIVDHAAERREALARWERIR